VQFLTCLAVIRSRLLQFFEKIRVNPVICEIHGDLGKRVRSFGTVLFAERWHECRPDFFRKKPFGQIVARLSNFKDESCAVERAVPTHDFEDSTLRHIFASFTPVIIIPYLARPSVFKLHLIYALAFAPGTSHAAQPRQMATRADIATGAGKKYIQLKARFTT
jgi:hypothetical protein